MVDFFGVYSNKRSKFEFDTSNLISNEKLKILVAVLRIIYF